MLSPHTCPQTFSHLVTPFARTPGDKVFTSTAVDEQRGNDIGNASIGMGSYNYDAHNAIRSVVMRSFASFRREPFDCLTSLYFIFFNLPNTSATRVPARMHAASGPMVPMSGTTATWRLTPVRRVMHGPFHIIEETQSQPASLYAVASRLPLSDSVLRAAAEKVRGD